MCGWVSPYSIMVVRHFCNVVVAVQFRVGAWRIDSAGDEARLRPVFMTGSIPVMLYVLVVYW